MKTDFSKRIELALADKALGQNFRGAMDFLMDKRAAAFPDQSDWQRLQTESAQIRRHAINHLPELLEQLEHKCTENGMQVHWAKDADEANAIILNITQQQGANRVIKGKSMASEEIELNARLQEQSIECTESDMGEYIVQLAGETPSHIIMPAIHKNKEQIAALFEDTLGESIPPEDVDGLIGLGRKVLREKFRQADIGVSGVNFAIAESGTLCLVENEGNGRLSTSAPETHIAIMGLEKVIPSTDDLPTLLKVLTRSATGQHITTYVNLISGPRKAHERDGPRQVHLIILDNGRSKIATDDTLKPTLACIRCGACMNHCPVYTRIGGHAYGSTYPGPIGQALMPQLAGLEKAGDLVQACSLNGACGEACPVGIPLPELIRNLRNRVQRKRRLSLEKLVWQVWEKVHQHPALYGIATGLAARFPALMGQLFPAWKKYRSAPRPAKRSLHVRMKERQNNERE